MEFGIHDIAIVGSDGSETGYCFLCPGCADSVERSAVPDVIALLLSAGAARAGNTPLTISATEIDEFAKLLDRPDWFSAFEASGRRQDD